LSGLGRALVAGGTKGLGGELSLALAGRGHEVVALYHSDDHAAASLQASLATATPPGRCRRHDLRADAAPLADELDGASRLTLVYNAGAPFSPTPFHLLRWEDVAAQLSVGVEGAFRLSQLVLPRMVRLKGGTIVFVLTTAVSMTALPPRGFGAYATAKFALLGLARAVAAEYHARGVRVLSVSPGFMETPLTAGWDARIRALVASADKPRDPARVAAEIVAKIDSAPGNGEDYPLA
jgi:NAD(P)-dependent dehydrogenase (short-subunit alcohol dehydrogenase family)